MSVYGDIRAALRTRLESLANLPAVAWEARIFERTSNASHLRETFAPNDAATKSLGPLGLIRHEGLYLIDCFVRAGKGAAEADELAGAVMAHFPHNLNMVYNGRIVIVRKTKPSATQVADGWIMVPVSVAWYCNTVNTI